MAQQRESLNTNVALTLFMWMDVSQGLLLLSSSQVWTLWVLFIDILIARPYIRISIMSQGTQPPGELGKIQILRSEGKVAAIVT